MYYRLWVFKLFPTTYQHTLVDNLRDRIVELNKLSRKLEREGGLIASIKVSSDIINKIGAYHDRCEYMGIDLIEHIRDVRDEGETK